MLLGACPILFRSLSNGNVDGLIYRASGLICLGSRFESRARKGEGSAVIDGTVNCVCTALVVDE